MSESPEPVTWEAGAASVPAARLRKRTRFAFIIVGALLFGFFGLSALLHVGGAVIASGTVAVESRVKTIVHPVGGVLEELLVHDGDRVKKGQSLIRFDTSVSRVGAGEASEGLDQLLARRARLEAQRENRAFISFPPELTRSTAPLAAELMIRERRLFDLKRAEREGALALLGERVRQYQEQISSHQAQIAASRQESVLIAPELEGIRQLYDRKLVTIARRNQVERTAVELAGQRAALEANIAEARARIAETREQMLNLGQSARADAATELVQVFQLIADQRVRRATTADLFARSIISAPQSGIVDKVAYTTIGSAIPAGQPIMQIVPDNDSMVIEGRVQPSDVDQLELGQIARISFSSLNRQVTPEVTGTLAFISAEPAEDTRTGQSYFRIRVLIDNGKTEREIKVRPVPGMPVEIFVQTGTRSILSFLTKPARDQLSHAMREQ